MMKPELLLSTASGSKPVGSACIEITRVVGSAALRIVGVLAAMTAPAAAAPFNMVRRETSVRELLAIVIVWLPCREVTEVMALPRTFECAARDRLFASTLSA